MSVAVQIAPERLQNKAKGRSLQVQVSTFNAGLEPLGGELNSYGLNHSGQSRLAPIGASPTLGLSDFTITIPSPIKA